MNDSSLSASPPRGTRVRLPGISPRAWEHPSDRAALAALRRVPGFDVVLRKLIGTFGERSLRLILLGSAVRVSKRQFSSVYSDFREICDLFDVREPPELFVAHHPLVNAGAIGVDHPFIVLHSATLDILTRDEVQVVLAHELGHVLSGHVLYKTMLKLLLQASTLALQVPLGGLALWGLLAALLEWDRKSEMSSDRAALLGTQDPELNYVAQMRLAGGVRTGEMNVEEFIAQAEEYEAGGSVADSVAKALNLLGRTHPFPVLRLADLRKWVASGAYDRILAGEYPLREQDPAVSILTDLKSGASGYREAARESKDPLVSLLRSAAGEVVEAGQGILGRFSRKDPKA